MVTIPESVIIGIVGSWLGNITAPLLIWLKVDDAVGATCVHGKSPLSVSNKYDRYADLLISLLKQLRARTAARAHSYFWVARSFTIVPSQNQFEEKLSLSSKCPTESNAHGQGLVEYHETKKRLQDEEVCYHRRGLAGDGSD